MESVLPNINNQLVNALLHTAIYALLTVILFIISRWVVNRILKVVTRKTATTLDDRFLRVSSKPLGILIILLGLNYIANAFTAFLPADLDKGIDGILYILIVSLIALWVMRLFSSLFDWYSETIAVRTESTADDEFVPLITRLMKIIIATIAIIIILKHFNQDVQSLVVSLGVGSLAIALAAQETLSNMIGGFVIMTDRPFRVGDRIELSDGKVGDVYQIGLRSTKLLTFDNTLVIVPNSEIVKERVINRSYPDPFIRVRIDVGVSYDSDVDTVKKILVDTFNNHPDILADPEPAAYFLEFGDSSLNFMVQGRVDSWKKQFEVAGQLRGEIIRRFRESGIEIPFPQHDVWIRTQPLEHRWEKLADKPD